MKTPWDVKRAAMYGATIALIYGLGRELLRNPAASPAYLVGAAAAAIVLGGMVGFAVAIVRNRMVKAP